MNPIELHNNNIHPAHTWRYDDLVDQLNEDVKTGRVNRKNFHQYTMYTYSPYVIHDIGWTKSSILARGLVVDRRNGMVAALPFPKFFNWGEMTTEEPVYNTPIEVTEKLDGSLGIAFWMEGDHTTKGMWRVVTKGSFTSEQALWATRWLNSKHDAVQGLTKGHTYLFEVIYPENRIVVDYGAYEGLILLSAYNNVNGREYSRGELSVKAYSCDLELVKTSNFTNIDHMLEEAKTLPGNKEGWVIKYPHGYRVKIKGDHYCTLHKAISGLSPISVWEHFSTVGELKELEATLPEEFHRDVQTMYKIYTDLLEDKFVDVVKYIRRTNGMTNKDIGLSEDIPAWVKPWVFIERAWLEGKPGLETVLERDHRNRKKFCESFRPKNNILEGYRASSAMNRFSEAVV